MEVCPYSYFRYCGYVWGPWVFCSGGSDEFSGRVTKNYFKAWSLTNSQPTFLFLTYFLTQWIMALLSKGCKPDNFQPHNSLKLSFTNIWGLDLIFFRLESFLKSNSPDILALYETNLDNSSDSGNFSVRVYLPLCEKIQLLICMVSQFMWNKGFLLHGTYL